MGRDAWPDLSVQISRRRWRCVPDPALCLTRDGAAFVRGLATQAEVWLTPEFHHFLDSWTLYDEKPELLAPSHSPAAAEETREALRIWLRLREASGSAEGRLCWVRDALRESRLPPGCEDSVVSQWEAMAEALDQHLAGAERPWGPLVAARRDAVALCAALPGSLLLTARSEAKDRRTPALCQQIEAWGLPCRHVGLDDDLALLERSLLLRILVEAGLTGFLWGGIGVSVIRPIVPSGYDRGDEFDAFADGEPRHLKNAWEDARFFWYELMGEDVYA
jgi:hypothetical protein